MKKTLKQLRIDQNNPNLITVVTEMKKSSKKKIGRLLSIILLLVIGIGFLIGFTIMIPTMINMYITTDSIKDYIFITISIVLFIPLLGLIAYFCLGLGLHLLRDQPAWYLVLYRDELLFKKYDNASKQYHQATYPISSIKKCIILKTEHVNFLSIKGQARESVHYTISVHIVCEIENDCNYVHLIRPDGFKELDIVISFLQNKQHIPIYYTYAAGEKYNYQTKNERKLIKELELERLTFNGSLKDFSDREFTRRVNRFKALERSNKHLQQNKE